MSLNKKFAAAGAGSMWLGLTATMLGTPVGIGFLIAILSAALWSASIGYLIPDAA